MSRPTVQRSDLAGWAGYGYCTSHSRFFWGLRLYLVCTPTRMPIMWALANPKIGEREVLAAMLQAEAGVVAEHTGILMISDKGFASKPLERELAEQGIELLRPSRKREKARYGEALLNKVRQLIESVNDTLKANSTWNNTAAGPSPESPSASCNACWPWPLRSVTTTRPEHPSPGH